MGTGLLREHVQGALRTRLAYDWGRAVHVAFWGLAVGLVDAHTAASVIYHAGRLSSGRYTSWADFSVGYCLGRVLAYDGDEFGSWYDECVETHKVLMSDAASPWRRLPRPCPW